MGQDSRKITSRIYWEHMADDIHQFVKNCEVCQRVNDTKFIKVEFLLSHKHGTRYFVCAHILIYMLDLFLLCILTGMSMVMVKRLRSGQKHQDFWDLSLCTVADYLGTY